MAIQGCRISLPGQGATAFTAAKGVEGRSNFTRVPMPLPRVGRRIYDTKHVVRLAPPGTVLEGRRPTQSGRLLRVTHERGKRPQVMTIVRWRYTPYAPALCAARAPLILIALYAGHGAKRSARGYRPRP